MQRRWHHWLIIVLIAVPSLLYYGATVYYNIVEFRNPKADLGVKFDVPSNRVLDVDKDLETEGGRIQKDDLIVAINGRKVSGFSYLADLYQRKPGDRIVCTIDRPSQGRRFDVHVTLKPPKHNILGSILSPIIGVLFPSVFVPIGLGVLILRPGDRIAILFCLLFLSLASITSSDQYRWPFGLREFGITFKQLLQALVAPLFYYFFSIFPFPSPIEKRVPWLKYVFLLIGMVLGFFYTLITFGLSHGTRIGRVLFEFASHSRWVGKVMFFCFMSGLLLGLISLVLNTLKAPTKTDRRRLRIIMWGAIASFFPLFSLILVALLLSARGSLGGRSLFLGISISIAITAILIFPLSFAYAIIKHKVIPVRLIVRRGLQYALVSRAFVALEALLIMTIFGFLWFGAGGFLSTLDPRILFVVLPIGGIVTFTSLNKLDDVFNLLALQISKALHVENVSIFLRSNDHVYHGLRFYHFDSSARLLSVEKTDNGSSLGQDSLTIRRLAETQFPVCFDLTGRDYFANNLKRHRPEEFHTLQILHSHCKTSSEHLLIPLLSRDEVIGFISLSEKLSEQPFTKEDKDLLVGLASQVSVAIENSKLAEEIIKQEQLRKELEIAKEVQVQLFPQTLPRMQTLDYCGLCIPARGVGGDYYDFLELGDGKLGLAIGDISGKGIGAALLMANLQAALRSHAPVFSEDVAGLVERINRLGSRSTGGNKYATFFYAHYDESTRRLIYANAGHTPPVLFRNREVCQLTTGGTVIGLFEDCSYEQGSIQLQRGDVLLAVTDGITEAFNPEEEEFGSSRLIELVGKHCDLSTHELQQLVIDTVLEFRQGAEQYDDMTIIVAKAL